MNPNSAFRRCGGSGSPIVAKEVFGNNQQPTTLNVEEETRGIFSMFGKSEFAAEPVSVIYYKDPSFYNFGDTHRLPGINIRKFWNDYTGSYVIHWSKRNGIMDGRALPNSHQQITALDLSEFITKLESILQEIYDVNHGNPHQRFMDNPFADITNRNNVNFWHPSLVETLANSDLVFRPFKDNRDRWSIRILKPVISDEHPDWTGIAVNLDHHLCYGFVKALKDIQNEIEVAKSLE